jgi:gas vesicle protein
MFTKRTEAQIGIKRIRYKMNEEKEVTKETGSKTALAVMATMFIGIVIGFLTGILFAPKKGEKTRKEIVDKSRDLYEKGKGTVMGAVDKTKQFTKESKNKFNKVVDIINPETKNNKKRTNNQIYF